MILLIFILSIFLLSDCFIARAILLKRNGDSEQPCLVPDLNRVVLFFHFAIILAVYLSWTTLIILRCISSSLTLSRTLIIKACWILLPSFYCVYLYNHVGFVWFIAFISLHVPNHPCISRTKPTWWQYMPVFGCKYCISCSSGILARSSEVLLCF